MEYPFKDLLPLDEVLEREGYYKDWTHLDPKVFYSLTQISEYIKTKGFGVDVRLLIAQLAEHFSLKTSQINEIERFFKDVMKELGEDKEFYSLPEIAGARRGYSTLAESLGNLSVGMINKNLGKLDQSFMTDEFLQQMAGDTPIHSTPEHNSITSDKLAHLSVEFLKSGEYVPVVFNNRPKNLFDKKKSTDGWYANRINGDLMVHQSLCYSDFIDVKPSTTYDRTHSSHLAWYDKNFNFINKVEEYDVGPITSPINATYIRVSIAIREKDSFMLVEGSLPEKYEPHYSDLKIDAEDYIEERSITENLLEKKPLLFTDAQVNLFNIETVTFGKYVVRMRGDLADHVNYTASDFIPIEGGEKYTIGVPDQSAWYDKDKIYIDTVYLDDFENPVTAPENARFLRVSTMIKNLAEQQVVKGAELLPRPVPYFGDLAEKLLFIEERTSNKLSTPEDIARDVIFTPGSIIDLWGDSRTHGSGGTGFAQDGDLIPGTDVRMNPNGYCWANSLRDLLQWKYGVTVRNYGQAGKNSTHYHQQMVTLMNQKPDLILMMIGTNDRHNQPNIETTKDLQRQMIELAHSKGIKVILMSAPPTNAEQENDEIRNFGMYDLDKAMNELAQEFNMKHISNYDSALRFSEARGMSHEDLLADGLHENDLGHDVIFRNVIRNLGISYVIDGVTK